MVWVHYNFDLSAMNAVNSNNQKQRQLHFQSSAETASSKTAEMQQVSVYPKIQLTNQSSLTVKTMKSHVLVLIRYGQEGRMLKYLPFVTFSIQTTHDCNRKKILL